MRRLPPVHQATLKALVEHLARVVSHNEKNRMDAKNLAIAFGGVIFGEDEMPKGGDLLGMQNWKVRLIAVDLGCLFSHMSPIQDTLMEDLINNCQLLFDENAGHRSPPLPPTPVGEPVPTLAYGTSHTKVTTVPPAALLANIQKSSEDFTPPLPPRPANSIHPSLRANTSSPAKERRDLASPLPTLPELQTANGVKPYTPSALAAQLGGGEPEGPAFHERTSTIDSQSTPVSTQATLPPSPKTAATSILLETSQVNSANTDNDDQPLPGTAPVEEQLRET